MARGKLYSPTYQNRRIELEWSSTPIPNENASTVRMTLYFAMLKAGETISLNRTVAGIAIEGAPSNITIAAHSRTGAGRWQLTSVTRRIEHDPYGHKDLTAEAYYMIGTLDPDGYAVGDLIIEPTVITLDEIELAPLTIGDGSGTARRSKVVWVGDTSGTPRRAKGIWIGDANGTPRRAR